MTRAVPIALLTTLASCGGGTATESTAPSLALAPCSLAGVGHVADVVADLAAAGFDVAERHDRLRRRHPAPAPDAFRGLFTIFDLSGVDVTRFDPAAGERVREHFHLFTKEGFGAVIYPEVNYNFNNGLELGGGALVQLGRRTSKFGDPAAGGSLAWGRARFSF